MWRAQPSIHRSHPTVPLRGWARKAPPVGPPYRIGERVKPFPVVHPLDHRCCFWAETFPDGPSFGPPVQLLGGNFSRWSILWTTGAAFGRKPFPMVHPLDHRCSFWTETFPGGPFVGPPVQLLDGNLSRWSILWTTGAAFGRKPIPRSIRWTTGAAFSSPDKKKSSQELFMSG